MDILKGKFLLDSGSAFQEGPQARAALKYTIENDASKKKIVKLKYHHVDSTQTVLAHRHEADVTWKNIARIANECHSLTVISLSLVL